MATTNLLQWNPTASNQEDDAAYLADSQRVSGATDPSLFLAELANKAFFQWSTFLTALFTAFANKGFTTSDSNISTLTAQCANFLTSADIRPGVQVVAYAPSLSFSAAAANGLYVQAMTGDLVISAITGSVPGQIIALSFQQDGVGNHVVSSVPSYLAGFIQPDPGTNVVSTQLFLNDIVTGTLRAVTPMMSSNRVFQSNTTIEGLLSVTALTTLDSLTLTSGAPSGQVLTGDGTKYIAAAPARAQGASVDVSGTRNFGTAYQNLTGGIIYVSGSGTTGGSSTGSLAALVGLGSPTIPVFSMEYTASVSGGKAGFGFMVPAGYFYQVNVSGTVGGTPTWTETQIS